MLFPRILPCRCRRGKGVRALHPKHRRTRAKHFGLCKFQALHSLIFMASASSCRTERTVPNNVAMLYKASNLLIVQLLLLSCVCILHSLHAQCVIVPAFFGSGGGRPPYKLSKRSSPFQVRIECHLIGASDWGILDLHKESKTFSTQILSVSMRLALAFFAAAVAAASCFAFLASSACVQNNPTRSYHLL